MCLETKLPGTGESFMDVSVCRLVSDPKGCSVLRLLPTKLSTTTSAFTPMALLKLSVLYTERKTIWGLTGESE